VFPEPLLKNSRGKRKPGEERLLKQVKEVFSKKREERGGAKRAAKELNICLASFYKYAAGTDLPRTEVLRDANKKWGIKWDLIDISEVIKTQSIRTPEQLEFSFLHALREEDVEIIRIGPVGQTMLEVKLRIHFRPSPVKKTARVT
jgi:hypothetical protein